nr:sulfatase [Allomuricauda sp.]
MKTAYQNGAKYYLRNDILKPLTTLLYVLLSLHAEAQQKTNQPVDYSSLNLPAQPNIVWIVAEDLSPFLPMYGDSTVATPNLSRLAKEGVTYTNVYSPAGVCAPSRAAIATGMYPTRIGAMHMRTGPWFSFKTKDEALLNHHEKYNPVYEAKPPAGVHMHSDYLRRAGYYCTNNRKEDYQFRCELTAWDESSWEAHWKNRANNQPFFAIFNLMVTHESRIWTKTNDSLWVDNFLDVPIKPYWPKTSLAQKDIRRMYSNIKEMDHQMGVLLNELEDEGLLEKTIVFWYTDHGGPLPRSKRTIYDSGIKVPMIIRFPNRQLAGQSDNQLLSFVDFKPTLLSLAGLPNPEYMDGRAWMGQYQDKSSRKYIYAAADRFDRQHDRIRAVRDMRYKYIRNFLPNQSYYLPIKFREEMDIMQELLRLRKNDSLDPKQLLWFRQKKDPEELFDTWNDPDELHNLANDPLLASKLQELRSALDGWISDTKDKGLIPEAEHIEKVGNYWARPKTVAPSFTKKGNSFQLESPTLGASIGYQWLSPGEEPQDFWQVYTSPLEIKSNKLLVARAHRIGYKPSDLVRSDNN